MGAASRRAPHSREPVRAARPCCARSRLPAQVLRLSLCQQPQRPAAGRPGGLTPARLYHALFAHNLLRNASFLERHNAVTRGHSTGAVPGHARGTSKDRVWVRPAGASLPPPPPPLPFLTLLT